MTDRKSWKDIFDDGPFGQGYLHPAGYGPPTSEKGYTPRPRCEGHPALSLGNGKVTGGPDTPPDADLYVWLDVPKAVPFTQRKTPAPTLFFPIQNYKTPGSKKDWSKLVNLCTETLLGGGHIHINCMAGHGRTGTLLACLAAVLTDAPDPVEWVRKNYCARAVEGVAQEKFCADYAAHVRKV